MSLLATFIKGIVFTWSLISLFCLTFLLLCVTADRFENRVVYDVVQTLPNLPPYLTNDISTNSPQKNGFVIRLHKDSDTEKHRFFCSGFVISEIYAVTAAHCLYNESRVLSTGVIFIHNAVNVPLSTAQAVTVNIISDLGLIRGDFSRFNKLKLGILFDVTGPFLTCGFPYGDRGICTRFTPQFPRYNFIGGQGALFPGMSGGPVIDIPTGAAVGVNSSTSDDSVNIAPLIGLFYAAHIEIKR